MSEHIGWLLVGSAGGYLAGVVYGWFASKDWRRAAKTHEGCKTTQDKKTDGDV